MFDFFAPGAKGGESQKLQFENNPIVEKMKSEMAEPAAPRTAQKPTPPSIMHWSRS